MIERFRVTPASRLAILMGPILSGLVMMMVFDAVVVVVGTAFGFDINVGGLLVLAVLLALLMVMMAAFSIATALGDEGHQQLRGDHQRHQPAGAVARRRAAADLARPAVDAGARALQPALLPRRGVAVAGERLVRVVGGVAGVRGAGAAVRRWSLAWATRVFQKAVS